MKRKSTEKQDYVYSNTKKPKFNCWNLQQLNYA